MFDLLGNGWNGGTLTVTSADVEYEITLEDGFFGTATFTAEDGEPIVMTFSQGDFPEETSFDVYDAEGGLVLSEVGPVVDTAAIFEGVGTCPSCLHPVDVFMSDVNADNAQVSWTVFDGYGGSFIIEFDTVGFTLGEGQQVNIPYPLNTANLTGLNENTTYEAYVFLDCGPDSSSLVGPIEFHTLWLNDVGVSNITSPNDASCMLGSNEEVTIEMTNYGQVPQTLFEFYFSVNGQVASIPVPEDGFFTGVIGNDSTQSISFETTWDFSEPDLYIIEAWTVLEGDSMPANDTFRVEIATVFDKPIMEDFESGELPADWTSTGFVYDDMAHGNETSVWGTQLLSFNNSASLTSTIVGPVIAGDSLVFDYRFVTFANPNIAANISAGDLLEVQISEDCGETFETVLTINGDNHDPTTMMTTQTVLLDDFDGKAIVVQFAATWASGNYWLDLDNINVTGCPVTFGLVPEITGSMPDTTTGQITVTPSFGAAPYEYDWDNGGDTETITDLGEGAYTVTVTDANGCTDVRTYQVGTIVSATDEVAGVEQMMLFPNPTSGLATLDVSLTEAMDFELRVLNMSGQVIYRNEKTMATQVREEMDFSNQPSGMYILQIIANGKPHFAKLMVTK